MIITEIKHDMARQQRTPPQYMVHIYPKRSLEESTFLDKKTKKKKAVAACRLEANKQKRIVEHG